MSSQETKTAKADAKAAKAHEKAMRPWYKKKRFAVPLGLVLLVALVSVMSGGDTSTENSAANDDGVGASATTDEIEARNDAVEGDAESVADPQVAGIGQPVRDGKFEFTVTGLECGATSVGDEFINEQAQGQFCMLSVTVSNIGDEAQALFGDNQYLLDDQDREFSADTVATFTSNPEGQAVFEEINPGNQLSGTIVFDVPADATISSARLHDSAFSNGVEVALS